MKKRSLLFVIIGMIIWAAGCKEMDEKFISEGEIEYSAKVIDPNNPMASMAPNKMTVRFKSDKSAAEMSAGLGLFSTSFITDPDKKTVTQLVKILNKKFMLVQDQQSIDKENLNYAFKFIPTKQKKVIAGYNCTKVEVVPDDKSIPPFDVYYTDELDIKDPNFASPYKEIKGVLMEYQLKKFGLEMRFEAKSVRKELIEDKYFQVPVEYKPVSEKEMRRIFDDLQ
ncbi:MAG TPA: hypothetical protein PK289_08995 [Bacteroidia bacterium]|nr:hypothetical protein [Bacteroidia bacterium]HRG52245.1 hypothetical protein [Bacteroidia bacterium]